MDLAQIFAEDVWRMKLVNNDSRLLLVAASHRNITSISNILHWKKKHGEINGNEFRRQFHVGLALLSRWIAGAIQRCTDGKPTLNHPKMISCGNTRDCSCQFFCFPNKSFPNYILVYSLWIWNCVIAWYFQITRRSSVNIPGELTGLT